MCRLYRHMGQYGNIYIYIYIFFFKGNLTYCMYYISHALQFRTMDGFITKWIFILILNN